MDEIFDRFVKCGKTYVIIPLAEDWQYPAREKKIKVADVVRYYARDARNITSGMRSIAGIHGDWRQIDYIANDCLQYFKQVNRPALVREGKKYGMTLR